MNTGPRCATVSASELDAYVEHLLDNDEFPSAGEKIVELLAALEEWDVIEVVTP